MAVGLLGYFVYRRYVLGRIGMILPLAAWLAVLAQVQQLAARAHAQAVGAALVGLASIALAYVLWTWLVRKDRA
jgi:hypothetical protein